MIKSPFSKPQHWLLLCVLTMSIQACREQEYTTKVVLNPYQIAPLSAEIHIESDQEFFASYEVKGTIPVKQAYMKKAKSQKIPILGLYPATDNKVQLTLDFPSGKKIEEFIIKTDALPDYFPIINVTAADRSRMEDGMHLCDMHYAQQGNYLSRPFIFDDNGDVRWYVNLDFYGTILWPIQKLRNGNMYAGGKNAILEFDMLGKILYKHELPEGYIVHHEVVALNDGMFLCAVKVDGKTITVDGKEIPSENDIIVLFNSKTKTIDREWDMAEYLDVNRSDINSLGAGNWIHVNGLAYDEKDHSIIVSGKNQGLAKISYDGKLQWILAPHRSWGKSGRTGTGFDTKPYLLTAVDINGKKYDQRVQLGEVSPPDFDFPWGQHAPYILPNGNLLVFDNGSNRHFKEEASYSQGIEYKIDEKNKTVRQVWQSGREAGEASFSMIISDIDQLLVTGNRLVTYGYILPNYARISEVSMPYGQEVFGAILELKSLNGKKILKFGELDILYRSERMPLTYDSAL